MEGLLALKVLIAQYARFFFKGLSDHVRHDRLPLCFHSRLDFEVSEDRGHICVLPFSLAI